MPLVPPEALAKTYTAGTFERTCIPVWSDDCRSASGWVETWTSCRIRVMNRR